MESGALSGRVGNIELFESGGFEEKENLAILSFLMREFGLKQPLILKGSEASASASFLLEQYTLHDSKIDLLFLDEAALGDSTSSITKLYGLLSRKGLICIETRGAALVPELFPGGEFEPVLNTSTLSVFARTHGERSIRSTCYQIDLFRRKLFFNKKCQDFRAANIELPLVTIVVLTYKHETYITDCLQSVLRQQGQFRMRIIIIDDTSPDGTAQVVRSVIEGCQSDRIEVEFHANQTNAGVVANLATALRLAKGSDYLTFCEGDDFWSSDFRIQEHIDFLAGHPQSSMSFNSIELCDAEGSSRELVKHASLVTETIEGNQLAEDNVIGNFTACFYRGALLDVIPQEIFSIYTVDWFFNIYCAQFGSVAHLNKPLSVYRQHEGGEWSARKGLDKATALLGLIDLYNAFVDFSYDEGFQKYRWRLYSWLNAVHSDSFEKFDLIVVDDVFPSSDANHLEFTSYLGEFKRSLVLTSSAALHTLENASTKNSVRAYQRNYPALGNRLTVCNDQFPLGLGKLLYANFLSNAYALLSQAEAFGVPFVFTLYPGAGFVLNNPECDAKLKRIFNSPCFQKVIVTQPLIYNYITSQQLCPSEKIEMIFGAVTPKISGEPVTEKSRWGFGKKRLDICFMADKYSAMNAGYDVFVNVASLLRQRHDDIYFHVVGPFDQSALDVSSFSDRVKFYGSIKSEEFDDFFDNMDFILAPNICGKSGEGLFEGFPTFGCTAAGLRGTALFVIDEFGSANGRFTDGEDIVLLKYDLSDIVGKIEHYYEAPGELKSLGEQTLRRLRELYSADAQINPRIKLLLNVIANLDVSSSATGTFPLKAETSLPATVEIAEVIAETPVEQTSVAWKVLRKISPTLLKKIYRTWKSNYVSR
ncbi:glycosyltransferase [Pseudomonas sp. NPDC087342]|uniref:glycosyltransferase n=1 Tax=Pseudomonas sp. NPDC087342 TaxID=3364437 RepID=UPI00381846F9